LYAVAAAAETAPTFGLEEDAVLTAAFGSYRPAGVPKTKGSQILVLPRSPVVEVTENPWDL